MGHIRVFPALSGPRPSRSSSWPVINIQCEVRGMPLAVLVAGELVSGRRQQPPVPSVALNPIRTRWMEHLERRPPCRRTMPYRTSCASHDQGQSVIWGQRGYFSRYPVQRVGVGLGTTDTPCRETAWLKIRDSSIIAPVNLFRCPQRRSVAMRCKLLHHERGLSHSAGKIF